MKQITADDVADYLQKHQDFFHDHLDLLEHLSIPHPSGVAVSLIAKQLEILRNKHRVQEQQLTELINIAKSNELTLSRLHQLTLALLEVNTFPETFTTLDHLLGEYFDCDFIELRLIRPCPIDKLAHWFISPDSEDVKAFMKELGCRQPKCARPTLVQARILFADAALEVNSCALVPLNLADDSQGILAIASREAGRFHYSMGQLFLNQIGEILSARLWSLLRSL